VLVLTSDRIDINSTSDDIGRPDILGVSEEARERMVVSIVERQTEEEGRRRREEEGGGGGRRKVSVANSTICMQLNFALELTSLGRGGRGLLA
jgi:hypothetical protein